MLKSVSDIEAMLAAAGRGAGMTDPAADYLAAAVGWLAARDLDGVAAAVTALQPRPAPHRSDSAETVRFSPAPILHTAGVALNALSDAARSGRTLELVDVDAPLLLLGYAGVAASRLGRGLALRSRAFNAMIAPDGTHYVSGPYVLVLDPIRIEYWTPEPWLSPVRIVTETEVDPLDWLRASRLAGLAEDMAPPDGPRH
ncbi:DUF3726 domain-containing protein [Oceanomicrobium pacificus]|uniref:DUF3726 domain-containing protein n=1 Tax=Oceanomicrobium pacificus TaxID=2692916 RepID=A0A6B0TR53_9RHOB|nr:DUF3726 domain-containing protein [Oceanomicrobium pacificus]MXU64275.1 DUF3726 domain-containing protein [Oceanomicrobium pacificus]